MAQARVEAGMRVKIFCELELNKLALTAKARGIIVNHNL